MFAGDRVPKQPTDLVQRERKNKALRGIRAPSPPRPHAETARRLGAK